MKDIPLHEKKEFRDMREMVEFIGEEYGDRVAYRFRLNPHDKEAVTVSYTQLRQEVRALATELIARGLSGKMIAVIGKHSYAWIRAYFALLCAGAVMVPLDKDWTAEELIDTVRTQGLKLDDVVTNVYPFEKAAQAFEDFHQNAGSMLKVMIRF